MEIAGSQYRLAATLVESRSELRELLRRQPCKTFEIGSETEGADEFVLVVVWLKEHPVTAVGLMGARLGTTPMWQLAGDTLLVGINMVVVFIDIEKETMNEVDTYALVYDIIVDDVQSVVVVCETALLRVRMSATIVWRIDTDVIDNVEVRGEALRVSLLYGNEFTVDRHSGRIVRDNSSRN